jgi:hypothetical protein
MNNEQSSGGGFSLAQEPVLSSAPAESVAKAGTSDEQLPADGEQPLLVAVARDPQTLFAYWNVDWTAAFRFAPPSTREVYLRVLRGDGSEEQTISIEPLAGGSYVKVAEAAANYRLELGYFIEPNEWRSVAESDSVLTPANSIAEMGEYQLVTVPMHLEFQQMVEMFRGARFDGAALNNALADLQKRAVSKPDQVLPNEQRVLEQMNWLSIKEDVAEQRATLESAEVAAPQVLQHWWDRILGIADSSLTTGFGGGS